MKFYLILDDPNDLETYEFFIIDYFVEVDIYCILVKLDENELKDYDLSELADFQQWISVNETEKQLYDFLKSKHKFIFKEGHGIISYGINCFELSNEDLMYMKLMDWLE